MLRERTLRPDVWVWTSCRICGTTDQITQNRFDELTATRPGTSDLCGVCWAKYGDYE